MDETNAITAGLEDKAREFREGSSHVYQRT